jgi:periplasmic protein TonB
MMYRGGTTGERDGRASGMAMVGTTVVHAVAALMLFSTPRADRDAPQVYAVSLIAAPRAIPERQRPEAVQRPAETPAPDPVADTPTRPVNQAPPPPPDDVDREETPETSPDVQANPDVEPSTGDDPETVDIVGVDFPFPGYLENIVTQIYRRWNRPAGSVALSAEIQFMIRRDGSVTGIQFVKRSGNLGFDLNAQGAIEAAAATNAFGPLPDGYANDILPVSFFFDPTTLRGGSAR